MFDISSSVHETGHIFMASLLGIHVHSVGIDQRKPRVLIYGINQLPLQEQGLYYAAGAACEQLLLGHFDQQGFTSDKESILQLGAKPPQEYIDEAVTILQPLKEKVASFAQDLRLRGVEARGEATFSSDPNSYEVLSENDITSKLKGLTGC